MKKMLYAGAALMIAASIYGFVDYQKASNKKEFRELYTEKKKGAETTIPLEDKPFATEKKELADPEHKEKTTKKTNSSVKTEVKKTGTRKFRFKEFGRGRILDEEELSVEKETLPADSVTKLLKK